MRRVRTKSKPQIMQSANVTFLTFVVEQDGIDYNNAQEGQSYLLSCMCNIFILCKNPYLCM